MERNYNNSKIRSLAAIFGSFLIQLTFGSAYTAETFIGLIHEESIVKTLFGLAMFGLSASMSFGGFIEKNLKRSKTIFLGCIIMSYAVFLSGIIFKNTKYLPVTYGLLCGLGAGLTYAITLGVPCQWSKTSKGFIIGIILSGFALGPLFYQAVLKVIQNMNSEYVFLILSGNYIVIQIIGIILIKKSKSPANPESNSCQQSISSNIDVASHKLFFEFDFWLIWLNLALNSVGIILFLQLYPIIFALNLKFSKNSNAIYVVSLTNAFGRAYWGYFSDKIPKQLGLILLNFGSIFMYLFLLLMFKYYETREDRLLDYTLFNVIIGIYCAWVSGNFSLIPALMADRFGEKHFPTNYGYVFTSYTIAGIITCFLVDKMAKNIPQTICILMLISLLSLMLSILLKLYPDRSITWRDIEKLFCCY